MKRLSFLLFFLSLTMFLLLPSATAYFSEQDPPQDIRHNDTTSEITQVLSSESIQDIHEQVATSEAQNVSLRRYVAKKVEEEVSKKRNGSKKVVHGILTSVTETQASITDKEQTQLILFTTQSKLVSVTQKTRKNIKIADLVNGQMVAAFGTVNTQGMMTASWLLYLPEYNAKPKTQSYFGKIENKNEPLLEIRHPRTKEVRTILISDATQIKDRSNTLTVNDLNKGDVLTVIGVPEGTNSVQALLIHKL